MVATSLVGLALYFFASLAVLVAAEHPADDSTFVGWRGASFDKQAVFGADGSSDGERWIETISWTPRAFIYHNFLSHEEANDLIVQAAPYLQRSTVVGSSDSGVVDSIRTSYGTFLGRLSSPAVERLEKRLANWTQLPIVHQEDIQVRFPSVLALSQDVLPYTPFWLCGAARVLCGAARQEPTLA
jgi:prolyl 4-hydroxylase